MSEATNIITEIGRGAEDKEIEGFVVIQYRINGLKPKKNGLPLECKNADILDETFTKWGFSVIVRGHQKGELHNKTYRPQIEKLPYEIKPQQSYFKIEKDFLFAWLKKKDESVLWETEIVNDTLENKDSESKPESESDN